MANDSYHLIMSFYEVGVFLVWLAFASLFYFKFKKQLKPRLIIHSEGYGCASMKLAFSNLADEPVYIRNIFIVVGQDDDKKVYNIDDLHGDSLFKKETSGEDEWEYQGTVTNGQCVKVQVGNLFDKCRPHENEESNSDVISVAFEEVVNVFVVFVYGADDALLGASRHFTFSQSNAGVALTALNWDTTIWSTRHERKKLMQAIKQERHDYSGFK